MQMLHPVMRPFNALVERRTQSVLVIAAAAVTVAVTSAYVRQNLLAAGLGTSVITVVGIELLQWSLWAASVPAIAWVEQRFGVSALGWLRGIAVHAGTAILVFLVINAALAPWLAMFELGYSGSTADILLHRAVSKFPEGIGIYSIIAGVLWLVTLAAERQRYETRVEQLESSLASTRSTEAAGDRLVVRDGGRTLVFVPSEILYITASGAYVEIHTKRGAELAREGIATLEGRLDPATFIRVHRSAIVNVRHVAAFRGTGHGDGEIQMRDGKVLPVSRARRDKVSQLLEPAP